MKAKVKIPVKNLPDRGKPSQFSGIYLKDVDYSCNSLREKGVVFYPIYGKGKKEKEK